ncbi:YeeE/YedE family protein [Methylorubrum sp. B1-46]|uniref:YeeE/YedE family protein n=1 Tax=Methylorubrum sp. B1-46 TaxID=2897334 RepID=UPI0007C97A55|nr:YeeE/YedE family protein [Methylorubrum sp. B1-46]OAH31526.1 SoxT protein, YeeE/YedE family protein [Methylorubrum populi]UGB26175.1 YeeE/YedE family protein [Methylorubrum sp. B1-46]
MLETLSAHLIRAALGLILGALLGFVARRSRFCTLGAIEDAVYARDTRRARAWLLAAGLAILGTQLLESLVGLDLGRSLYSGPTLEWGGLILGGTIFGLGMALVGTCSFGALLRLGGGDLRAFLVLLVIGLSAYMAISGVIGVVRVSVIEPLSLDLGAQRLGVLLGLDRTGHLALSLTLGVALCIAALAARDFRQSRRLLVGAVVIGGLIVAGWWTNGYAGYDAFETRTVGSFSFARPVGDTLLYVMLASGVRIDFGVASVVGVLLGSYAAARQAGEFHWEAPDDAREVKRHVLGAFLMGTGGVTALGCTIGQGLSGLSTLSVGSMLAIASILVGARAGLYYLVDRHA